MLGLWFRGLPVGAQFIAPFAGWINPAPTQSIRQFCSVRIQECPAPGCRERCANARSGEPCFAPSELPAFVAVGYYGGVGTQGRRETTPDHPTLSSFVLSLLTGLRMTRSFGRQARMSVPQAGLSRPVSRARNQLPCPPPVFGAQMRPALRRESAASATPLWNCSC